MVMSFLASLLVDLVIIGITMEVVLKALRSKAEVGARTFFALAFIALAITVVVSLVELKLEGRTSLWTGAVVAGLVTSAYIVVTRLRAAGRS
jgi:hypothetical protein